MVFVNNCLREVYPLRIEMPNQVFDGINGHFAQPDTIGYCADSVVEATVIAHPSLIAATFGIHFQVNLIIPVGKFNDANPTDVVRKFHAAKVGGWQIKSVSNLEKFASNLEKMQCNYELRIFIDECLGLIYRWLMDFWDFFGKNPENRC